ncbi:GGDEF domain-containing protein [Clostridium sp. DSM 100503]|uniref:bifunctional diguanylate cyclase/phosphodiesterase n=1 Tax=Clostridium sp. DSM 100503 TaxID=2963282 RepID=UPI002149B0BB|nr:GGDEF domain-containing protein [Clostridium sp. DSM 100503]MCR1951200.1 GGDEF domain-containing protein [Clostridium sp. DSM 100503]
MISVAKFNNKYKKGLSISICIVFILILIIGVFLFRYHNRRLSDLIDKEARAKLKNVSSQNVIAMQAEIEAKQKVLESLAKSIEDINSNKILNIVENLKIYSKSYGFYNMGIINKGGICYTTLGEVLDLSKYDYYKNGMNGIAGVSKSYFSEDKQFMLNIFTFPIYNGNDVEMILTATYKSEDFYNILNIDSFNGEGKSVVVDKLGNLVSNPNKIYDRDFNVFHKLKVEDSELYKVVQENVSREESGFISYNYEEEDYLIYYEPLNINDWYLISYVPNRRVYQNADIIFRGIHIESALFYITFILAAGIFILSYNKYQKKISYLIFIDELTKERNYQCLRLHFENMKQIDRKNKSLVVFDIDKFNVINIMHGTDIGDDVLKYIVRIFKEVLPNDELYKDKADAFIGILYHDDKEEIIKKLNMLDYRIKTDIERNEVIPIKISMGICSLDNSESLHSVYSNALMAKREIKDKMNQSYKFFDEQNKRTIIDNKRIESEFSEALKNDEFEVWYQPKYDMRNKKICGAEALIRWRKKDGSLISPAKFIPVFENNGQIIQLDEEVIRKVCKDIKEMSYLGYQIHPISVNLSRMHLEYQGIVERIEALLEKYDIDSSKIAFEITESVFINNNDKLNSIVDELHKLGFKVEMDDYGTGISALSSISRSSFDTLKLDKSFIDNIGNPKMDIIIKSTIDMAKKLNMKIIAEGIETQEQVEFLIANNCFVAQGYYFSKPVPKNEYISLLSK